MNKFIQKKIYVWYTLNCWYIYIHNMYSMNEGAKCEFIFEWKNIYFRGLYAYKFCEYDVYVERHVKDEKLT